MHYLKLEDPPRVSGTIPFAGDPKLYKNGECELTISKPARIHCSLFLGYGCNITSGFKLLLF